MVTDLANRIVNECSPTPGIQILLIIRNSSIIILKFLKVLNLILPLLTLIECIRSDQLQNSIDSVHINFLERTLEYVSTISKQTFLSSDIITSNDRTLGDLRIHMMPGNNCAIIAEFVILIGSNSASVSQVEVHDRLALDKLCQCVHYRLEHRAASIKLKDGMYIQILVNPNRMTDSFDEMSATTTVILPSHTKQNVRAIRKAIEIDVPQLILIDRNFVKSFVSQHSFKMLIQSFLHPIEFHIFSPFKI